MVIDLNQPGVLVSQQQVFMRMVLAVIIAGSGDITDPVDVANAVNNTKVFYDEAWPYIQTLDFNY